MELSKDSADAFLQCLRILAPRMTPPQRANAVRNAETYIQQGKWIPTFKLADIALLFFPKDSVLEMAMLADMKRAIESEELVPLSGSHKLLASELAAWPGCPPVPLDSPLRYWLPDWMQAVPATPAPATPAPVSELASCDGPAPLTTSNIAHCFDGLRWSELEWKKPLGDKPKWLSNCIAIPGQRGVSETRWNPVLIGSALVDQGHVKARSVRAKFQAVGLLKPWCDAWKTYEADNFDSE